MAGDVTGEPLGQNVLVVDDDPITRACLRKYLQAKGYQVLEAGTAKLALMGAKKYPIVLTFLDIGLPDRDGLSITGELAALQPEMKIVLLSTDVRYFEEHRAKGSTIVDFLVKPVTDDRIDTILMNVLNGGSVEKE